MYLSHFRIVSSVKYLQICILTANGRNIKLIDLIDGRTTPVDVDKTCQIYTTGKNPAMSAAATI